MSFIVMRTSNVKIGSGGSNLFWISCKFSSISARVAFEQGYIHLLVRLLTPISAQVAPLKQEIEPYKRE
jgi:hypothetical protein